MQYVMALVISTGLMACADDTSVEDEHTLRSAQGETPFWDLRANDEDNGPVAVYDGDPPTLPPCIIWDIDGGEGVHEGPAEDGILVATMDENRIVAADGNIECVGFQDGDLYKLRDVQTDEILYTATHGRFVFEGNVDQMPRPGSAEYQDLLQNRLALEFYQDQLSEQPKRFGVILATAGASLQHANPMRKMTLAAMYGGDCGSNGPRIIEPAPQ